MRSIDVLAPVEKVPKGGKEVSIEELSAEIANQIKEGIKASLKEVPPEEAEDPKPDDPDAGAEGSAEKEGDGNA